MLSKKNRIGNRNVIQKIFAKGKLHKDRFLVFKYETSTDNLSRFAVVVGNARARQERDETGGG